MILLSHLANAFPHPWGEACFKLILWILLSCFYNSHGKIILTLYKVYQIMAFWLAPWQRLCCPGQWCKHARGQTQCSQLSYFPWMPSHYCHSPPEIRTKMLYESKGWAALRWQVQGGSLSFVFFPVALGVQFFFPSFWGQGGPLSLPKNKWITFQNSKGMLSWP